LTFAGCGSVKSTPGAIVISWGDGNPSVPQCSTVLVNCKAATEIQDLTTGVSVLEPIAGSYAGNAAHQYQARVDGYDENGALIESPWIPPKFQ
jgi:hypothetical protein